MKRHEIEEEKEGKWKLDNFLVLKIFLGSTSLALRAFRGGTSLDTLTFSGIVFLPADTKNFEGGYQ